VISSVRPRIHLRVGRNPLGRRRRLIPPACHPSKARDVTASKQAPQPILSTSLLLRLHCERRRGDTRSGRRSHQRSRRSPTTSSNSCDCTRCFSASSPPPASSGVDPSTHTGYYGPHARSDHVSFVTFPTRDTERGRVRKTRPGP